MKKQPAYHLKSSHSTSEGLLLVGKIAMLTAAGVFSGFFVNSIPGLLKPQALVNGSNPHSRGYLFAFLFSLAFLAIYSVVAYRKGRRKPPKKANSA